MKNYMSDRNCPECGLPMEVLEFENNEAKGCKIYRCPLKHEIEEFTETWKNFDKSGLVRIVGEDPQGGEE